MPALIQQPDGSWIPYEEFNKKEREREGITEEKQQEILAFAQVLVTLDNHATP